jgi:hypothetical protein
LFVKKFLFLMGYIKTENPISWSDRSIQQNVAAGRLALLRCISAVLIANQFLGSHASDTTVITRVFPQSLQNNCWDSTLKQAKTASFQILPNLLSRAIFSLDVMT